MSGFTIVHMDDFERPFPKWALARKSLGLQSFGMNVCELAPGETIPEHDETGSDQEEVFIVLDGNAQRRGTPPFPSHPDGRALRENASGRYRGAEGEPSNGAVRASGRLLPAVRAGG